MPHNQKPETRNQKPTLPWFRDDALPLYLAPMARFTDVVYRQICKEQGADVMVTEFIRANSIVHGDKKVWEGVDFSEEQRPMGVQIFGSEPNNMAEAARQIVERMQPDFIDINFGCPADKITCANAGSSLLRDPQQLRRVAQAVIQALPNTPVTAKMRIGWDEQSIVALEIAQLLVGVGIQAIAIHGRTKEQGYQGEANWEVIEQVASTIPIPVIGNGNIQSSHDVLKLKNKSAVSGLMIGRAALGYPWIFREIKHFLKTGEMLPPPTLNERWQVLITYAEKLMARPFRAHYDNIRWMRPKFIALTKDMCNIKKLRGKLQEVNTIDDLKRVAQEHMSSVNN